MTPSADRDDLGGMIGPADRTTWTPVGLPASMAGHRLLAVAADGDRVIAAGQNPRGATVVVVVDGGGDPNVAQVPPITGRDRVTDLAVVGDTVLIVTGVTAITDGFLATGSDRVDRVDRTSNVVPPGWSWRAIRHPPPGCSPAGPPVSGSPWAHRRTTSHKASDSAATQCRPVPTRPGRCCWRYR